MHEYDSIYWRGCPKLLLNWKTPWLASLGLGLAVFAFVCLSIGFWAAAAPICRSQIDGLSKKVNYAGEVSTLPWKEHQLPGDPFGLQ